MNILKRIWLTLKSGFYTGVEIGKKGKNKEFVKSPFKTIGGITNERIKSKNKNK